jgi:4-hydroxy-tetrahydrodipicolinate reductase
MPNGRHKFDMTKVIITGAKGRMGKTLVACLEKFPGLELVGEVDLGDNLLQIIRECDVVVDFSFADATARIVTLCAEHRKAVVIGTTGHSDADREDITRCQARIPMVWASNYSTGVNVLFWLTRKTSEVLGPDFDVEIVEMHHRLKKDAPSGTACTLSEIAATARKLTAAQALRHGRQGLTGERTQTEIGMHSLRGGDVVGDHTVMFATAGERIELTHRASSRETFACGALRSAQWVIHQKPGLYDMQDVLGLKQL